MFLVSFEIEEIENGKYTGFVVRVTFSRDVYWVGPRVFSDQIGRENKVVPSFNRKYFGDGKYTAFVVRVTFSRHGFCS